MSGAPTIRLASAADIAAIAELYGRISEASFGARFMTQRGPTGEHLRRLAAFDPERGDVVVVATVAADPAVVIGEARAMPTTGDVAEFAIVVDDAAQGRGVGRLMMARLLREAEQRGIARLSALVLLANTRMRRLVDPLGWALVRPCEYGVLELEVSTRPGMPGWADDGRRRVLVESSSYFDDAYVARLRAAGAAVRRCPGPTAPSVFGAGRQCPLVTNGTCRLAEQADEIIDRLPPGDGCDEVLAEHRRRWPERLHAEGPTANGRALDATR